MSDVEAKLEAIQERNKRVETDKAWELSWTRRGSILIITYCTAALFLWLIDDPRLWLNALVPSGGYLLSTFSLPWLKRWWTQGRSMKPWN